MASFKVSARASPTNMPLKAMPPDPKPLMVSTAAPTRATSASPQLMKRRFSDRNTPAMRITQAMENTNISGSAGSRVFRNEFMSMLFLSAYGCGRCVNLERIRLAKQLVHRDMHHIQQRRRPHTHGEHGDREQREEKHFAPVGILELLDRGILYAAENHALVHPQRIGGAKNERGGGQERDPEIRLEGAEYHQELADEAGRAGQPCVRHREQHHERHKHRHAR